MAPPLRPVAAPAAGAGSATAGGAAATLTRFLGLVGFMLSLCGDTEEACENHTPIDLDHQRRRPEIVLDTSLLFDAFERGRLVEVEAALGDRRPVIPPAARDEFFAIPQPGKQIFLDSFMARHQGRTGAPHDEERVKLLVEQAEAKNAAVRWMKPPLLDPGDARVYDSAVEENLPVMTSDRTFHNYMILVGWPSERIIY